MISLRKARVADAIAIGAVHVAAWRSSYPGILPDTYLARMSVSRQAAHYDAAIRGGTGVMVATASGVDVPIGSGPRIIGFSTAGRARHAEIAGKRLAEGEVETLYVLDDWRERGVGRRLMRASASHLIDIGCKSAFVWVLRENPAAGSISALAASRSPRRRHRSPARRSRRRPLCGIRSSSCWRLLRKLRDGEGWPETTAATELSTRARPGFPT